MILEMILKTIFFYFFVAFAYRIMGKREVGQLGIIDLIVTVLIAELVAISISEENASVFYAIGPIVALVILEVGLAFISIKSKKVRKMLGGKISLIINNGVINYQEMLKQRYNLDDLLFALRQKGIKSIEEVDYAILELTGELSIFTKGDASYPMPVVLEGVVQENTLREMRRSKKWLLDLILRKNLKIDDVFYAFYRNRKLFVIKRSELN